MTTFALVIPSSAIFRDLLPPPPPFTDGKGSRTCSLRCALSCLQFSGGDLRSQSLLAVRRVCFRSCLFVGKGTAHNKHKWRRASQTAVRAPVIVAALPGLVDLTDPELVAATVLWGVALWFGFGEQRRLSDPLVHALVDVLKPLLPASRAAAAARQRNERSRLLSQLTGSPSASDNDEGSDKHAAHVQLAAQVVSGVPFGVAAAIVVVLLDQLLGAGWPLSSALVAVAAALIAEVGRPKALTQDEMEERAAMVSRFDEFASLRLRPSATSSVHISTIADSFRKSYSRYRTIEAMPDRTVMRLMRKRFPRIKRTQAGFYRGLALVLPPDPFR